MDPAKLQEYAISPAAFRRDILIDSDTGCVKLGDVMDPWQRKDFETMDPAWLYAMGRADYCDGPQRAMEERPRGHSKTQDGGVMACYAVAFAARQISGICAAGSKDQARLLRDSIARLVRVNRWLSEVIEVLNYRVTNVRTGSKLDIIAADAGTAYGHLVDFIVIDELTNWADAGEQLWHALISAAAKRAHCLVLLIQNAGFGQGTSWQWNVREACRESEFWYFSRQDGPVASWIAPKLLAEQKALLPPSAYQRLWLNTWTAGKGDCLDPRDIERCITLPGPMYTRTRPYDAYLGAFDLGYRKDRSAFVVLAADFTAKRIALASCESWSPKAYGGELPLLLVKDSILDAHRRYCLDSVVFDPHQAVLMAQELGEEGLNMFQMWPTAKTLDLVAKSLLQRFYRGQIDIYEDKQLIRDLQALNIVEKQSGLRLVADRSAEGHADTAIAFAMGLHVAYEEIGIILYREPPPIRVIAV